MMGTAMSQESISQAYICSLVEDGALVLETEAGRKPDYNGVVVTEDTLLVIDGNACNLQLYSCRDGKLLSTSHRLESYPMGICLISKTEVAVCLYDSKIVILSFKYVDDVKLVKTLNIKTGFDYCHSVAKLNSDKLVVSGDKYGWTVRLRWGVVSITDGRVDSTHTICKGYRSHLVIQDNTVYISCWTSGSTTTGVYAYDIFKPHTHKFMYQHQELIHPGSIMADRNCVYVIDMYSNIIHQLTDSGELVTMHTVSSSPCEIFYDDQHGVLYTTSSMSNLITVYRLEYSHQTDSVIPAEVLKMDTRSLQMYKEALNEGKEKVYNIRVMVVGQYGVGKTTLTQRLLGKYVNISERHSTDGIDVHVECSKVALPAGEWTTQENNAEQYSRLQRLVKILNESTQKQESKSEQEGQSQLDGQVTREEYDNGHLQHDQLVSKEHDNGHPKHDQPVSAEPDTNQEVEPPTSQAVHSPIARVVPEANSEKEAKENKKDTVMEILQLVNEHSGHLEKSTMEYAALALWDFAGQYVFYTTHQIFLTSRAIYLLVIDLSQQVTDLIKDDECFLDTEGIKLCKVLDLIEIWMNSIHSCTPSSQPSIPYVILVGTHVDKIPENCRQRVIDEYFIHICEILSNKPAALHLMDYIVIDNTQNDLRLEELKKRIFELAKQQPHWGEEKPARWLPLEQAIMTLKASGVKVAPLSLIEEINRSGSVRIENRDELDLFLRFQHEMGTVLYFSIERLREKILLDPQWLIDALKSLITAGTFINKIPAIVSKWSEFKMSGKLTHELIDAVWSKEKNPEFHDNKDHIILLMEKLNIIARPRTFDQEGKEIKVENYFLAPCMLREKTPEEVISPKPLSEMDSSSVLCYVFVEQFLPSPIFHRLLAACVAHWPVAKKNSETLIYCGCCVFHLDLHHRLTVFFREHVIFVRVTRMGTTGETLSTKLCIEVKEFITMTLSNIIGNLEQSLRFELHIKCPRSDGYRINSLIRVADLQRNVDIPCHSHAESHVIISCDLLKFWFQEEGQTVIEGIGAGKESKVSKKGKVASMDRVPSTSIKKGKTDIQDQILPQAHDVRAKTKSFLSKLYQSKGVPCSDPTLLCQILHKSHQTASSSQSALEENCMSLGLKLHGETPADGNCFFEAVSSQLQRLNCVVQKSPQQLRQEVVAFMKTNRVLRVSEGTIYLDSFIYNESFNAYCTRMAREGEWADHLVVVAMARMLQIDIMIVTSSPSSGPEDVIVWVVGQTSFQEDPILLGHVWESHYQSLQPIGDKTLDVMGRDEVIEDITPETSTQMEQADVPIVVEGKRAGTKSKVSEKDVTSIKNLTSTSSKTVKLHRTVLNRCLPELMKDLDIRAVMMYIQQKELFGDVTIRDILEQKTTSESISMLIRLVQKRSRRTYKRFKECLVLAKQADLKEMLEEEEAKRAAEIKGKHEDTGSSTFELKTQIPVASTSVAQTTHLPNVQTSASKVSATTASRTKAPATAAPTTIEETTQSPNVQRSAAKFSTPTSPVTKAVETAAHTPKEETTHSPKFQTSTTKPSAAAASMTKALSTVAPTTKKQTTQSVKVQTSTAIVSTTTGPLTTAPTTTAQTTKSPKPQASVTKDSTAVASRKKSEATAAPSTEDSAIKAQQSQACDLM